MGYSTTQKRHRLYESFLLAGMYPFRECGFAFMEAQQHSFIGIFTPSVGDLEADFLQVKQIMHAPEDAMQDHVADIPGPEGASQTHDTYKD